MKFNYNIILNNFSEYIFENENFAGVNFTPTLRRSTEKCYYKNLYYLYNLHPMYDQFFQQGEPFVNVILDPTSEINGHLVKIL